MSEYDKQLELVADDMTAAIEKIVDDRLKERLKENKPEVKTIPVKYIDPANHVEESKEGILERIGHHLKEAEAGRVSVRGSLVITDLDNNQVRVMSLGADHGEGCAHARENLLTFHNRPDVYVFSLAAERNNGVGLQLNPDDRDNAFGMPTISMVAGFGEYTQEVMKLVPGPKPPDRTEEETKAFIYGHGGVW